MAKLVFSGTGFMRRKIFFISSRVNSIPTTSPLWLNTGPPLFPEDYLTDQSQRRLAAERIREKLLELTNQELPHATAVITESWHERSDGLIEIEATILVDRESQKPIVIGRGFVWTDYRIRSGGRWPENVGSGCAP
ncbi:MAG: KH domain-containing protein [Nitrospinae bacterium]|nr:KH domain-containing protein [Nitrospinota bacterium]